MASNPDTSPTSTEPTNNVDQSNECTHGPDKPYPPLISTNLTMGGNFQPIHLSMDTSMDYDPTINGNTNGMVRKSPLTPTSFQHRAEGTDSKAGGPQNKGNAPATGGTNGVQRAWGRNAYRIMPKEHGNVRCKSKASLKTKLRRLSCKAKPSNGPGNQPGQSCAGELGRSTGEREGQMP